MQVAYLDNAATTMPLPEVVETVSAVMAEGLGNASARHSRGARAKELMNECRATIADALGVEPEEVYFTSGGTEANNLAVCGAGQAARSDDPSRDRIIASDLEHPSVTKSVRGLKRAGWDVAYVRAPKGELDFAQLERYVDAHTSLVTVMRVQNELGYVFPVHKVAELVHERQPGALVHSDGVQAFGKVDFLPAELGVDLASICAHKIGGPQGIGALYVKRGTHMFTTAFGGGQERGLRSGTEAVPLIAGFACAVKLVMKRRQEAEERVRGLKRYLLEHVCALRPDTVVNSRDDGSPYIVSFSVPGLDDAKALDYLNERGICVSQASACETLHPDVPAEDWRSKHPTALLLSGVKKSLLDSTLRISFSQQSTQAELDAFLAAFSELCK